MSSGFAAAGDANTSSALDAAVAGRGRGGMGEGRNLSIIVFLQRADS